MSFQLAFVISTIVKHQYQLPRGINSILLHIEDFVILKPTNHMNLLFDTALTGPLYPD